MKSNENAVVYNTEETVAELNKVRGFDPMKYALNTENGAVLDLPHQKLWFRLKHPNGRIRYFIKKLSDNIAAIEARVFFDRRDSEPVANHIVSGVDITDKNAVAQAQRTAAGNALSDAGFGLQFVSANPDTPKVIKGTDKKVVTKPQTDAAPKTVTEKPQPAEQPKPVVEEKGTVATEIKSDTPAEAPVTNTVTENITAGAPKPVVTEQPEQQPAKAEDPLLSIVNTIENNGLKVNTQTGEVVEETPTEQAVTESADTVSEVPDSTVVNEVAETPSTEESTVSYDKDTPVEEICKVMSLDDAMNYVIEGGPYNGWKMSTLADRRPRNVLELTMEKYPVKNNILRAALKIILDNQK